MSDHDIIPVSYCLGAVNRREGIEVAVLPGDREAPEHWGPTFLPLPLHPGGSVCFSSECACGGVDELTVIDQDQDVVVGDWTWHGGRSWAVGWRRFGPSAAETELRERLDVLSEDLEAERGNHRVTAADLNNNIRLVKDLETQLEAATTGLGRSRQGHEQAAAQRDLAERWVLGLAVAVVALVVALVWAVIA